MSGMKGPAILTAIWITAILAWVFAYPAYCYTCPDNLCTLTSDTCGECECSAEFDGEIGMCQ